MQLHDHSLKKKTLPNSFHERIREIPVLFREFEEKSFIFFDLLNPGKKRGPGRTSAKAGRLYLLGNDLKVL